MTGFEPGSSGIGSDRSANCATTTAPSMQSCLTRINISSASEADYHRANASLERQELVNFIFSANSGLLMAYLHTHPLIYCHSYWLLHLLPTTYYYVSKKQLENHVNEALFDFVKTTRPKLLLNHRNLIKKIEETWGRWYVLCSWAKFLYTKLRGPSHGIFVRCIALKAESKTLTCLMFTFIICQNTHST